MILCVIIVMENIQLKYDAFLIWREDTLTINTLIRLKHTFVTVHALLMPR